MIWKYLVYIFLSLWIIQNLNNKENNNNNKKVGEKRDLKRNILEIISQPHTTQTQKTVSYTHRWTELKLKLKLKQEQNQNWVPIIIIMNCLQNLPRLVLLFSIISIGFHCFLLFILYIHLQILLSFTIPHTCFSSFYCSPPQHLSSFIFFFFSIPGMLSLSLSFLMH